MTTRELFALWMEANQKPAAAAPEAPKDPAAAPEKPAINAMPGLDPERGERAEARDLFAEFLNNAR